MSDRDPPLDARVDRPLSLIGAVGWTALVVLLFSLILSLSATFRPGLSRELVNLQICFGLAMALGALLLTRLHLPSRDGVEALGARPTPWWLLFAGLVVGVLLQAPALWLDGWISQRWPLAPEEQERQALLFSFQSVGHKVAFVAAAGLVGPLVEEGFCRGALFRTLRRTHGPGPTVLITTGCFALLHLDPRYAANAALCGLALGALRLWSGSLWVSLAAHVAFNSVTAVALLGGWVKLGESRPLGALWGALGTGLVLGVLAAIWWGASRSEVVAQAVEADED
ncbi:MAG: CPBP family intramembrane metalloprotease [Polyangiaceae bacterium]|jgi:membrane protease YdiL (CAAX protease family)|nr:CPBP family intramembrane metalloprotease [Polyangiaceae bacterium]